MMAFTSGAMVGVEEMMWLGSSIALCHLLYFKFYQLDLDSKQILVYLAPLYLAKLIKSFFLLQVYYVTTQA